MSEQKGDSKQTLIEEGTAFKGDFDSDCPIIVKGHTEGRLKAPSLTVSSTGSVSGTVKVKELRSEGQLSGEYDADFVQLSGSVKNNTVIRARALEVNLAPAGARMQVVFGECELEVGEVPTKEESVARAESAWKQTIQLEPAPAEAPSVGISPVQAPPIESAPIESAESTAGAGIEDAPTAGKSRKDRGETRRSNSVPPPAR